MKRLTIFFQKLSPPESSPDLFFESRTPSRNELLLKMSEEKRREKLQKERAKLLEATLMTPTEMQQEPEAIPEVVMKKQPDPSPVRTRTRIPIRQRQRRPLPGLQENIGNSNMPAFSSPRAAFQVIKIFSWVYVWPHILIWNGLNRSDRALLAYFKKKLTGLNPL